MRENKLETKFDYRLSQLQLKNFSSAIIERDLERLVPWEVIYQIRQFCLNYSRELLEKKIIANVFDFSNEIRSGLSFPCGIDTQAHYLHLKFFETFFNRKNLTGLDIATGCGEFTYLSKLSGHDVLCTAHKWPEETFKLETLADYKDFRWARSREIFQLDYIDLPIKLSTKISFKKKFDFIYINQCTIHFPGHSKNYWSASHWAHFLSQLENILNPGGIIFITLADPSYITLGHYLKQFYYPYEKLFNTAKNDETWYPLLLIHDENRNLIQTTEDIINNDLDMYRSIGKSTPASISS